MNIERMRICRLDLLEAVRSLERAFEWEHTEEGQEFWSDVHLRLKKYLNLPKKYAQPGDLYTYIDSDGELREAVYVYDNADGRPLYSIEGYAKPQYLGTMRRVSRKITA